MRRNLKSLERYVDYVIPYLLIVLLGIIFVEIFFHEKVIGYYLYFDILDYIIIVFFIVDLTFKFNRIKKFPKFFKKYWLEILAVFPFFLVFRFLERFVELYFAVQDLILPQRILHEGIEVERVVARESKLIKFFRPLARSPRLLIFKDKKIERNFEDIIKKEEERLKKESRVVKRRFLMGLHFYKKP